MYKHLMAVRKGLTVCLSNKAGLAVVLVGCWILVVVGCGVSPTAPSMSEKGANEAASESTNRELSPDPAPLSPDNALLKKLETAGVKIAASAKTGKFESADLSQVVATDELAHQLASIDSLTQLVLRQSQLSPEGWKQLSGLNRLQHLDLRDCPIDDSNLAQFTTSMRNLRSVRLSGKSGSCQVTDTGLQFLADQQHLKVLALDGVKIGKASLERLSNCRALSELYLASTLVDDHCLPALGSLTELKKLRLAQTSISAAGLGTLANSNLPLEELDVSECSQVDDVAAVEIGKLTNLKRLNLWSTLVGDGGVMQLAQLARLQWLNLDNTKITDAALPQLRGLKDLGFLHLGSTAVSDDGIAALSTLSSLKKLVVTRTKVTQAGVENLQKLMPAVDIQLQYVAGQ